LWGGLKTKLNLAEFAEQTRNFQEQPKGRPSGAANWPNLIGSNPFRSEGQSPGVWRFCSATRLLAGTKPGQWRRLITLDDARAAQLGPKIGANRGGSSVGVQQKDDRHETRRSVPMTTINNSKLARPLFGRSSTTTTTTTSSTTTVMQLAEGEEKEETWKWGDRPSNRWKGSRLDDLVEERYEVNIVLALAWSPL